MDRLKEIKEEIEDGGRVDRDDGRWLISETERLKKDLDETSREADEAEWKVVDKSKEIERYKHTLEHDTKEIKLLTAEIDSKDGKIEQLKKEKEWLKQQILLYQEFHPGLPYDEKMELLEVEMQQELKEK